jgi:hypothetical protein
MCQKLWFGAPSPLLKKASSTGFIDRRVQINGNYYTTKILEKIYRVFLIQQNEAPLHTANENLPDFILKA